MTNTQAAKAILADTAATPRERRYAATLIIADSTAAPSDRRWALNVLEQFNGAKHRDYDQQAEARNSLMIGRAA